MSRFLVKKLSVQDGLYRVVKPYLCGGIVVENGRVVRCAPILRRKIGYWLSVAERVDPKPAVPARRKYPSKKRVSV
jgi:hypothetical protein